MKKFLFLLLILLIFSPAPKVKAENLTLQAGVSMSDRIPKGFFGTWEIFSTISYTNNKKIFNETTTDYWNLSKTGDVITLANPVSGAEASVTVEDVKGNQIKFTHVTKHNNAKMIETPTLTLNGENICDLCTGTGNLILSVLETMGPEEAKRKIANGNIYLYDIDDIALNICLSILRNRYGDIVDNIHIINVDCLDESVQFPENAKIISNPPYGK